MVVTTEPGVLGSFGMLVTRDTCLTPKSLNLAQALPPSSSFIMQGTAICVHAYMYCMAWGDWPPMEVGGNPPPPGMAFVVGVVQTGFNQLTCVLLPAIILDASSVEPLDGNGPEKGCFHEWR